PLLRPARKAGPKRVEAKVETPPPPAPAPVEEIDEAALKRKLAHVGEALERAAKEIAPEALGPLEDRYLDLQKEASGALKNAPEPARAGALAQQMKALENAITARRRS